MMTVPIGLSVRSLLAGSQHAFDQEWPDDNAGSKSLHQATDRNEAIRVRDFPGYVAATKCDLLGEVSRRHLFGGVGRKRNFFNLQKLGGSQQFLLTIKVRLEIA